MEILVESGVRSTVLAVVVAVLLGRLRIGSPRAAHQAWVGVTLLMLVLPAFVAWGPKAMIPVLPEQPATVTGRPVSAGEAGARNLVASASANTSGPVQRVVDWRLVVVLLYGSGVVLLLGRLAIGLRQARMLVRDAVPIDGRLTHRRCITPVTVGLLSPVVILPPDWVDWPDAELAAILAHEEEHVRRRDPLAACMTLVNRAVFWFHPLAWWLPLEVSRLSEHACDAVVVSDGHDADVYAASLLRFARSIAGAGGRFAPLGTAMPGNGLRQRLAVLANRPAPRADAAPLTYTVVAYAAAVVVCAAGTLTSASAQSAGRPAAGEWSRSASEHFDFFYQRPQESRLDDVTREAEAAFAHVSEALKYEVPQRVSVILVSNDRDRVDGAEGRRALVQASGAAPARNHVVVSVESLDTRPGVLRHELTHHFAFEIIPEASRIAPWLAEGLAEHQRGLWDTGDLARAQDAVRKRQLPALASLSDADRHWGHALFDFVAAEYGGEGIRRYLFALRTRPRPTDAIPVAFGVTLGAFEQAFNAYIVARFTGP
jgi:hypothetical protein